MTSITTVKEVMGFNAIVEARIAFGARRRYLIDSWMEAAAAKSVTMNHWAKRITENIDAELALSRALELDIRTPLKRVASMKDGRR